MEFHRIYGEPISLTRAAPWNSIELEVRQFRRHEQFHGIPWNLECANIADKNSSMEFHGTWNGPMSMTRAVSWNSVELGMRHFRWHEQFLDYGVRQFRWHEQFYGIPWKFMELGVRQFRWHEPFHEIPWNYECANFADTSSSMNLEGANFAATSSSMESHGIPWNLECANFADTSSSMEFHGIPWNFESANFTETSSSMEFHGTWSAPISMTRAVPWNSMELQVRQFRWHEQFHEIPWN